MNRISLNAFVIYFIVFNFLFNFVKLSRVKTKQREEFHNPKVKMVLVTVSEVEIDFPFIPYACQLKYMERVLECLKMGLNGALESPTGTGKTVCLLCACLGYLEHQKRAFAEVAANGGVDNVVSSLTTSVEDLFTLPKIYYAARTHSQLSQVVKELNKTIYKTTKICLLGSRDQLCLNDDVKNAQVPGSVKNQMCRMKVGARTCQYYCKYDRDRENIKRSLEVQKALDIEDFIIAGKSQKFCPYYASRDNYDGADLILLPYNYILDPRTRRSNKIDLKRNIVIFDEGHNLEKMCEESVSVILSSKDLSSGIKEAKGALQLIESAQDEFRKTMDETSAAFGQSATEGKEELQNEIEPKQLLHFISLLLKLEKELDDEVDKIDAEKGHKSTGASGLPGVERPGIFMQELLKKAEIHENLRDQICSLIDRVATYLTLKQSLGEGLFRSTGAALQSFSTFLSTVFPTDVTDTNRDKTQSSLLANSFSVYLAKVDDKPKPQSAFTIMNTNNVNKPKADFILNYWCWSPGLGMQLLMGKSLRSVIITSGTLSPLTSFVKEMKISIPVTLENYHVITKDQVFMGILSNGPDGTQLLSNFQNRNNPLLLYSLGQTIINVGTMVSEGLLVFFPSYPQMDNCIAHWKDNCNIFQRLLARKEIFIEPKNRKEEFVVVMREYDRAITNGVKNGAILFAVCRGKVSEGIDFSDRQARAVIIAGIPYPPLKDPKVVLKRNYLDKQPKQDRTIGGSDWYQLEAVRAVNQAMGRVIRHKDDFGAIILADCRFSYWNRSQYPGWLRDSIKGYKNYGEFQADFVKFFKRKNIRGLKRGFSDYAKGGVNSVASAFEVTSSSRSQPKRTKADEELYDIFNPKKPYNPPEEDTRPPITYFAGPKKGQLVPRKHLKITGLSALEALVGFRFKFHESKVNGNVEDPSKPCTSSSVVQNKGPLHKQQQPEDANQCKGKKSVEIIGAMKKSGLDKSSLSRIFRYLKDYKDSTDFDTYLKRMSAILLPSFGPIFEQLSHFVLPEHRPLFRQAVEKLDPSIFVKVVDIQ